MYPVSVTAAEAGPRNQRLGVAGIFLVKLLLAIPHLIILSALDTVANAVAYVGYFFVAFTGELPPGMRDILVGIQRWQTRTWAWIGAVTDAYPPFTLESADYPVRWDIVDPTIRNRRLAVAGIFLPVKVLLVLPHLVALVAVGTVGFFATWVNFFIIAFTGNSSPGIHNLIVGLIRWGSRVMAWLEGLVDEYPPFRLSP